MLTAIAVLLAGVISGVNYRMAGGDYVSQSLLFAYAMTYPDTIVRVMYIIPIKMKWLAWLEGAFFALGVISSLFAGQWASAIIPVVALLNFSYFSLLTFIARRTRCGPGIVLRQYSSARQYRLSRKSGDTTISAASAED